MEKVTDIDGNIYNTAKYGKQIWEGTMKGGLIIDDDEGSPYHLIEW